jgi:hypothetical protein
MRITCAFAVVAMATFILAAYAPATMLVQS